MLDMCLAGVPGRACYATGYTAAMSQLLAIPQTLYSFNS